MKSKILPRRLALALVVLLFYPTCAFAWGEGHDLHLLTVMDLLPPAILSFFLTAKNRDAMMHESHYPDNFSKFTEEEVGAPAMELLTRHKLPHRYSLHSETGKAVNLLLLSRAMAQKDAARASTWFAALSHTLADEAACNHDPLVEPILFAYKTYGIALGKGCPLDIAELPKSDEGAMAWKSALGRLGSPEPFANLEAALLSVYTQPVEANVFLTRRGGALARSFNTNAGRDETKQALEALSECGAEGVRSALRFTVAAWHFATEAGSQEWSEALAKRAEVAAQNVVKRRSLSDDSIYAGALDGIPGSGQVAVLVEPSVAMDKGVFGFNSKTILAAILRELGQKRIPHRALDVRDEAALGALTPENTRVLVLCVAGGGMPQKIKNAVSNYAGKGGKLFWIGGRDAGLMGNLSKALKPCDPTLLPVAMKYGDPNTKAVESLRLILSPAWAARFPSAPEKLAHNPNTSAGWHVPRCALSVDAGDPAVTPLVSVGDGSASACVCAVTAGADGRAQFLFMPIYLLAPFAWTKSETMEDFSRPTLDSAGRAFFSAALSQLGI